MFAQRFVAFLPQAAQVDDARQVVFFGGRHHVGGGGAVRRCELPLPGIHGVDQIIGHPAALCRRDEGIAIQGIPGHDLQGRMPAPGTAVKALGRPRHGPHPIPGLQQPRDQSPAHITGATRHQNRFVFHDDSHLFVYGCLLTDIPKKYQSGLIIALGNLFYPLCSAPSIDGADGKSARTV